MDKNLCAGCKIGSSENDAQRELYLLNFALLIIICKIDVK